MNEMKNGRPSLNVCNHLLFKVDGTHLMTLAEILREGRLSNDELLLIAGAGVGYGRYVRNVWYERCR